ncbi:hypothetical protein CYL18_15175 [Pradoshia eiseniae]|uniref:Uncharacterized protein n=1 Tax=Pradoshia eiseniae TaxID=2064768 RepID=A0A2S7MXA1_9BACI|nr:hypothetical protein [Pradoshia eiseniae]PQD94368.1 hypothetical protein CYL18_15175 [Pradoshia eiseniae]
MNKKSPNPQILLFAAITATIMTISDSMMEWEKKIHAGIFAFLTAIVAAKIAQLIIKDEPSED